MKRLLLFASCLLVFSNAARADWIGVFADGTHTSCNLGAPGINLTAAVVHFSEAGTTGSRFKIAFPAGTTFFSLSSPYVTVGSVTSDISFGYGQCLTGYVVLGTIAAQLTAGHGEVKAHDLIPFPNFLILYTDCVFAERYGTGLQFWVGGSTSDCGYPETLAMQPSTWGSVKALYR